MKSYICLIYTLPKSAQIHIKIMFYKKSPTQDFIRQTLSKAKWVCNHTFQTVYSEEYFVTVTYKHVLVGFRILPVVPKEVKVNPTKSGRVAKKAKKKPWRIKYIPLFLLLPTTKVAKWRTHAILRHSALLTKSYGKL